MPVAVLLLGRRPTHACRRTKINVLNTQILYVGVLILRSKVSFVVCSGGLGFLGSETTGIHLTSFSFTSVHFRDCLLCTIPLQNRIFAYLKTL